MSVRVYRNDVCNETHLLYMMMFDVGMCSGAGEDGCASVP